jgi:fructose-1,6-bisphosphatase/inositol monophosphatase family enzyme
MTPLDLGRALGTAVDAARAAGDILRRDFHRVGGARGHVDKAEADVEAEVVIRARLIEGFPSWGYLGEETGRGPQPAAGAPTWLVDPNDGTRDYLEGRRGSAVSIGLVASGVPVLGVVFAFAYPDDDGDLFVWAEGQGPLLRNGRPVLAVPAHSLRASDVVLVSSAGDRDPKGNLECVAPARFRTVPSIAHRLALVAAGEAVATSALFAPREWDYGGGHALLRASGGVLVDESGAEVRYAEDGTSRTQWTLGGSAAAVELLSGRPWASIRGGSWGADRPVRLARGEAVADSGRLSRAQGCLLGLIAGGSLGAIGFRSGRLEDGAEMLAGQPTGACESALALARSIVARGSYAAEPALTAFKTWLDTDPFDVDPVTLVRSAPLAIFASALGAAEAGDLARADSALTHSDPACGAAAEAFVVAVVHAVARGDGPEAAYRAAFERARGVAAPQAVTDALARAAAAPPMIGADPKGRAVEALHGACFDLLHAQSVEAGVAATVQRGGDITANAAITGSLLGAVHGRNGVPAHWRNMVLSCRSHPLRAPRPRPSMYWPTDVLEVAERLLLASRVRRE